MRQPSGLTSYTVQIPGAVGKSELVAKKTQALVSWLFSKRLIPESSLIENCSSDKPVLLESRLASVAVIGITVSRQHILQPFSTQGELLPMIHPRWHMLLNEREGVIQEGVAFRQCRAIRVVWISFRPSEPETWVRILHCPPNLLRFRREAQVPAPCP